MITHIQSPNPHIEHAKLRAGGFTLVELLLVAVIVAIFAAIVVPGVLQQEDDVRLAAAQHAVKTIQKAVDREYSRTGQYPSAIDQRWFRNYKHPVNPYNPGFEGVTSNVWGNDGQYHPRWKTVESHDEPFYYNPTNGIVRVRVAEQATNAETLALYNAANSSRVTSLSQTKPY